MKFSFIKKILKAVWQLRCFKVDTGLGSCCLVG